MLTHELGHVLGYDDLDPQQHPEHLMAGVLQPGVSRIALPTDGANWNWAVGESDSLLLLERGSTASAVGSERAPELSVVDRALNDLLDDAPRAADRGWMDSDDEYKRLLSSRSDERYEELDAFFARL